MSLLDDLLTTAVKNSYEKNSYEKNKRKESEPSILGALKDPQFLQDMKRGVLDSVTRGAVASTIGGPVDLATMVMRPFGYNVEKPIGGSEWVGDKMQQMGLLGDYRNPIAEGLASVAVPGAMAKVAHKVFQAEQAAIQNANIAGPLSDGKFATQRGVFGGLNAKTADKAKLSQAEQMLNKGVDPAQVWKETGWGRGPDGKWRFEIPDDAADFGGLGFAKLKKGTDTLPLNGKGADQVFTHEIFADAYPDMHSNLDVGLWADKSKGGHFSGNDSYGQIRLNTGNQTRSDMTSTGLHELQHAIQQREGFARGGSPEAMPEVIDSAIGEARRKANDLRKLAYRGDPLDPFDVVKPGALDKALDTEIQMRKLQDMQARLNAFPDSYGIDAYQRLGGEAEARLVQSRMNLTPEERAAQFPWNPDYFKQQTGVGLDDLIHRFDAGEAKSVGFTYPQDAALETARQNGVKMLGLPENNSPMDRAKALGFTDAYHGSKNPEPIKNLVPGGANGASTTGDAYGLGVYTTTDAAGDASSYGSGGGVFPLMIRRDNHLMVDSPSADDLAKLSKFSGEQMLPSDKARFSIGRETRQFKDLDDARDFFANQRENWNQFGGGYDRARPEAIANNDGTFAVQFTNFDAPVPITNGEDVGTLLKATGWDNVPALGYSGHTLDRGNGRLWDITADTSKLRSRFAAFDPARVNENDLLAGAMPFGLLLDPEIRDKFGR